jgi:alpha-glucosidase (family GH31 glycosyl hydrolase)
VKTTRGAASAAPSAPRGAAAQDILVEDPAMRRLHALGFKVTLWVMPFVEESSACYAEGCARGYFVSSEASGGLGLKPGFFRWWQQVPAVGLDVTNPAACDWFVGRLRALQEATGVDGFKFDAGEPCLLPAAAPFSLAREDHALPRQHARAQLPDKYGGQQHADHDAHGAGAQRLDESGG